MKNNIWQSLDFERFLHFHEEREKKISGLTRFNGDFALVFAVLRPVSHLPPFSLRRTLEAKVSLTVCEDKCCLKGVVDDRFTGAIVQFLTSTEESSQKQRLRGLRFKCYRFKSIWGRFLSSLNRILKVISQQYFLYFAPGFLDTSKYFLLLLTEGCGFYCGCSQLNVLTIKTIYHNMLTFFFIHMLS